MKPVQRQTPYARRLGIRAEAFVIGQRGRRSAPFQTAAKGRERQMLGDVTGAYDVCPPVAGREQVAFAGVWVRTIRWILSFRSPRANKNRRVVRQLSWLASGLFLALE